MGRTAGDRDGSVARLIPYAGLDELVLIDYAKAWTSRLPVPGRTTAVGRAAAAPACRSMSAKTHVSLNRIRDLRAAGESYHKVPPSSTPKGDRRSVAGRGKLRASARSSVRRRRRRGPANRCQLRLDTRTAVSTVSLALYNPAGLPEQANPWERQKASSNSFSASGDKCMKTTWPSILAASLSPTSVARAAAGEPSTPTTIVVTTRSG